MASDQKPAAMPPPPQSFGQQLMSGGAKGAAPVPQDPNQPFIVGLGGDGVSFGTASTSPATGPQSNDLGVVGGSTVMTAPIPPVDPTTPDAKSDPTYQLQATQLARQLADFRAQQNLANDQYTGQYNQTTRRLGYNGNAWDRSIPNGQYGQAMDANEGDFAGRNMVHSGQFANAENNVQQGFNTQLNDVNRARTDFQNTAALSAQNMASSQELARQQALASAVAGIAARYGININQVPNTAGQAG